MTQKFLAKISASAARCGKFSPLHELGKRRFAFERSNPSGSTQCEPFPLHG
jgi:hypothetical protein